MPEYHFGQHTIQYLIERSGRRRTLSLVVDPQRGLVARAPLRMAEARIADFVRLKAGWALRHLKRLELSLPQPPDLGAIWLRGEKLRLEVDPAEAARPRVRQLHEALIVSLPRAEAESGAALAAARGYAEAWLRRRAGSDLRPLVARYAAALGRPVPLTLIRSQSTRWGSCAPDGTLRLNWRLVCLPPRLAEYVCAHECCHLAELNHSARFWRLLSSVMPDYAERRRELREASSRYL